MGADADCTLRAMMLIIRICLILLDVERMPRYAMSQLHL